MKQFQFVVDEVKRLRTRDYRRKTGLTIAEGYPEVTHAIKAGTEVRDLFLCPQLIDTKPNEFDGLNVTIISKEEFSQIAFGARLKGILAIVKPQQLDINTFQLKPNALVVVVEGVEKPGNLGTVLRTSDGVGVDCVINCDGLTDLYNHNIVRSSIGTVFYVPGLNATKEETHQFLKRNNVKIFATSAKAKRNYAECDFTGSTAFILGSEHAGISQFWQEQSDEFISIPMNGQATSLNVAASTSVLLYEALRQRT